MRRCLNKDYFRTLKDLMLPGIGDRDLSVSFFASKTASKLASGVAGWSEQNNQICNTNHRAVGTVRLRVKPFRERQVSRPAPAAVTARRRQRRSSIPDPQPGGSQDTRGYPVAAEFSGSVRRSLVPRQEATASHAALF